MISSCERLRSSSAGVFPVAGVVRGNLVAEGPLTDLTLDGRLSLTGWAASTELARRSADGSERRP
jgi:hypothetical protein